MVQSSVQGQFRLSIRPWRHREDTKLGGKKSDDDEEEEEGDKGMKLENNAVLYLQNYLRGFWFLERSAESISVSYKQKGKEE